MNPFSNYIDRQKAGLGSSEKSQKVHSANWKEEIQLRKELHCLGRQEEQRVSRISSDQRLVVHRFHRKLSRSVEVAQNHEKLKDNYEKKHQKWEESQNAARAPEQMSLSQLRCLSANPKPPVIPKFRRAKSRSEPLELQNDEFGFTETRNVVPIRPMTALERRNKVWERQLNSVTQTLNRARSAPARCHLYKVPEFSVSTEIPRSVGKNKKAGIRFRRPAVFEIDIEQVRRARECELRRQREAVKGFLKNIESLELQPWKPPEQQEHVSGESAEVISADAGNNAAPDTNCTKVGKVSVLQVALDIEHKRQAFNAWT